MRRVVTAIVAASVAGCTSAYDAVDPELRIETPLVWPGTDIVLTSPDFLYVDTLPVVLLGDDTMVVRFAMPDTLHVVAPDRQG